MKRSIIISAAFFILITSIQAYGLGLGVYADGSAGRMFLSDATWGRQVHDNYAAGCGIIMHVPFARVKDAAFRMGLGFDRVVIPRTTRLASDYDDTFRLNLTGILAWTYYRRGMVGLRAGPQIAFSAVSGRVHSAGTKRLRDLSLLPGIPADLRVAILIKDMRARNRAYSDLTLCLGPALGLDVQPDEVITVSVDAGFRGGVHLLARSPGKDFRYEGFCEAAVLLRVREDAAPGEVK